MSAAEQNREAARYVIFGGLAFGVAVGVVLRIVTGSAMIAFHAGFWSGFLFGFALKTILKVSLSPPRVALDLREAGFDDDENVLHHGPANHFKGLESVGGKLFLTNRRLRFRSHKFNLRAHDESFPLASIASVEPARTLGLIPNALVLRRADGTRERFVVMSRAHWVAVIRAHLEAD